MAVLATVCKYEPRIVYELIPTISESQIKETFYSLISKQRVHGGCAYTDRDNSEHK